MSRPTQPLRSIQKELIDLKLTCAMAELDHAVSHLSSAIDACNNEIEKRKFFNDMGDLFANDSEVA